MSTKANDLETRTKTLNSRTIFANFVQRRELINQGRLVGGLNPNNAPSFGTIVQVGAVNTTAAVLAGGPGGYVATVAT